MYTHLPQTLRKFYSREGNKIIFRNKMSLNKLALVMWERLGFVEIDASVLSRVLRGERLFTPRQLQTFCDLLTISQSDREYLFYCLHLDQCSLFGVKLEETFFSHDDVYDFLQKVVVDTSQLVFKGKVQDTIRISNLIIDHIRMLLVHAHSEAARRKLLELLGTSLYFKGRAIGGLILPLEALPTLLSFYEELSAIAHETGSRQMQAYAATTYSSAYCISGADSFANKFRSYYQASIRTGKQAITYFSDFDQDKYFALWTIFSAFLYLQDQTSFFSLAHDPATRRLIEQAQPNNLVQATHLYHIIARGEAFFGLPSASDTYQLPLTRFGDAMRGMRIQEVADIRTELEMLLSLKTCEKEYMLERAERALSIAEEEGSKRLKNNIDDIVTRITQ
ncbi:hypothetical protein HY468_01505 [Candidatus Roizmanbacteria bacterium]|nr:hypothetical protein [Candidatus Roizmanbacteria bacterium]